MTEAAPELSTTLEAETPTGPSGGGMVNPPVEEAPKEEVKPSLRDTIADEMKKGDKPADKEPAKDDADATKGADGDEDGETEGKAVKADKADPEPEKKAEAKPVKAEETDKAEGDKAEDKPGHYKAPKNFLPDSREKWTNVPRPVQRDIDNMTRQHEEQVAQLQKATERYEAIREFDEHAQSNGRDLRESLTKLAEIENLMQSNPYAGLNAILQEIGPRRPDGSAATLYEVAQFITQQGPEKWQQIVGARPQQQQPVENSEVAELRQQIEAMKVEQTASSVIEPFKATHPRYDELRDDIALFLKSGKIPASLSPADRLAAAYDMAERVNPPSDVYEPATQPSPDADSRVDTSSGSKSIKSAPGSSSPDLAPKRGGSTADILRDEMRRRRA